MGLYHFGRILRTLFLGLAIVIFATTSLQAPVRAQQADSEPVDLILAVVYPPYIISQGLLAFQVGDDIYLPFVELAESFEFFIEPDLENGFVSGYIQSEENDYAIDTTNDEYVVRGESKPLPPNAVITDPFGEGYEEIFVLVDILNEIWPIELEINLSALNAKVTTEEKLAFELRFEREERQKLVDARKQYASTPDKQLPFVPNDYQLLGKPALDLETEYAWDTNNKRLTGRKTFTGLSDLGYASADYAASFNLERSKFRQPRNIRLRLNRQAFGEDTFPLRIKNIEAGDVRILQREHIANNSGGRGVMVTSFPPKVDSEFDQITIEGTGNPGWEIELYRNDQLIDFGEVDERGEYRFENVPLNLGNNQMRIVLYGPQGQVRERLENYRISGSMLKPGETHYTAGVVDNGRDFILLENTPRTTPRGIAASAYVARGINKNLTLFGSLSKLPTNREEKKYATVGAMASLLGGLGQAEIYKEAGGGHALDVRFATNLRGVRLNLQSAFFKGFESPSNGFDTGITTYEGNLSANKNFKTPIGSLGLNLNVNHQETKNGLPFTKVDTQQSLGFSGVRISNQTDTSFQDYAHTSSTGNISATVRMQQWQLRSQLNYNLYPDALINSINGQLRFSEKEDGFSAAVNAQHNFVTSTYGGGLQLGYDFGPVLTSFDVGWIREEGFNFRLRASTSLGPYGKDGRYILDNSRLSRNSPVQGRVFIDYDGDGVFSEGDEPVPEARLQINNYSAQETSDEEGYVTVKSTGAKDVVNVSVDKASLIDPYFQPSLEGYSTVPRPGSMPIFEFPVIETGAIDGTVYRENGSPISGMNLELLDAEGEIIMTTETAYDGFYTFEFVPPGTYTVRADPSYQVNVPPETVTVTSDDLFTYGIDLQLLEQAAEVEAAKEAAVETQPVDEAAAESGGVAQTHHGRSNGTGQPAPLSTEGDLSAFIKRVRIGEHPDKVRLVLDVSGPVAYLINSDDGGKTITIDLPGAGWDAIRHWRGNRTPILGSFKTEALSGGGTRLILIARDAPIEVSLDGLLKPGQSHDNHRLYIDLQAR